MPLPVAGLCPEPGSVLIRNTEVNLMRPCSLQACLGFPGMWPQAPSLLTCSQPTLAPTPVGL